MKRSNSASLKPQDPPHLERPRALAMNPREVAQQRKVHSHRLNDLLRSMLMGCPPMTRTQAARQAEADQKYREEVMRLAPGQLKSQAPKPSDIFCAHSNGPEVGPSTHVAGSILPTHSGDGRPSTRVNAAPGGGQTFAIGDGPDQGEVKVPCGAFQGVPRVHW